jgi:hypothetical protein
MRAAVSATVVARRSSDDEVSQRLRQVHTRSRVLPGTYSIAMKSVSEERSIS